MGTHMQILGSACLLSLYVHAMIFMNKTMSHQVWKLLFFYKWKKNKLVWYTYLLPDTETYK